MKELVLIQVLLIVVVFATITVESTEYEPNEHVIAASKIPRYDFYKRDSNGQEIQTIKQVNGDETFLLNQSCVANKTCDLSEDMWADQYLSSLLPLPILIFIVGIVSALVLLILTIYDCCCYRQLRCCFDFPDATSLSRSISGSVGSEEYRSREKFAKCRADWLITFTVFTILLILAVHAIFVENAITNFGYRIIIQQLDTLKDIFREVSSNKYLKFSDCLQSHRFHLFTYWYRRYRKKARKSHL